MSNRPTTELTTINGHVVVFKSYITGREYEAIEGSVLESAKISVVGGVAKIDSFDATFDKKADKQRIISCVVSVDGQTENVLDAVLDLQKEDYQEVLEKVNEITGKKKPDDTNSQSETTEKAP